MQLLFCKIILFYTGKTGFIRSACENIKIAVNSPGTQKRRTQKFCLEQIPILDKCQRIYGAYKTRIA